MKKIILVTILIAVSVFLYFQISDIGLRSTPKNTNTPKISDVENSNLEEIPLATIISQDLEIPWGIAFLPSGELLITERTGNVRLIDEKFQLIKKPVLDISDVKNIDGEGGLHGITLHPDFTTNKYVYLYYTYKSERDQTLNRVQRYIYDNQSLVADKVIIENIPGSLFHDGGRIKFGPDGLLYITTGDAQKENLAQEKSSLAGKILRITGEGEIPEDNPFGNAVYSYGHRNPQGIAWDNADKLWSTEHGRSGVLSGLDEINLIKAGNNYGWPAIQGDETKQGMNPPIKQSGPNTTWAPACLAIIDNRLFFSGLRGEALYETLINDNQLDGLKEYFKGKFGRIRECIIGPDEMLYITTSNRDGRGEIRDGDDKIIRINIKKL